MRGSNSWSQGPGGMEVRAGTPFLPGCSPQPLQGLFPGLWGRGTLYSSIWDSRAEIEARRFFVGEPGHLLGKCKWTGRGRWGEGSKGPSGAAQGPCSHRGSSVGPCPGSGPVSCRLGVFPVPPLSLPCLPSAPSSAWAPMTLFSAPLCWHQHPPPNPCQPPPPWGSASCWPGSSSLPHGDAGGIMGRVDRAGTLGSHRPPKPELPAQATDSFRPAHQPRGGAGFAREQG